MFLAMDSQAVMAGTHDQNVEMKSNVRKIPRRQQCGFKQDNTENSCTGNLGTSLRLHYSGRDRASATADRRQSFGSGSLYTEHHVDSAKPET